MIARWYWCSFKASVAASPREAASLSTFEQLTRFGNITASCCEPSGQWCRRTTHCRIRGVSDQALRVVILAAESQHVRRRRVAAGSEKISNIESTFRAALAAESSISDIQFGFGETWANVPGVGYAAAKWRARVKKPGA